MKKFSIGLDYGTDSVRAVLVETNGGKELVSAIYHYPRWKEGKYCNLAIKHFRQHPLDHIEGLEKMIARMVKMLLMGKAD